jgi:hypothetical protein
LEVGVEGLAEELEDAAFLLAAGRENRPDPLGAIPGTAYQIGNGPPGGTSEAAVRREFVALGSGAWNASEALACDGPDLLRCAQHPLCWWPQSGKLPPARRNPDRSAPSNSGDPGQFRRRLVYSGLELSGVPHDQKNGGRSPPYRCRPNLSALSVLGSQPLGMEGPKNLVRLRTASLRLCVKTISNECSSREFHAGTPRSALLERKPPRKFGAFTPLAARTSEHLTRVFDVLLYT